MQEKLVELLLNQDELDWKKIIYDLVESEQMDPWDIDITLLTQKFIQVIKAMQEHDFTIPGKILLAAAVLLKIKATHLVDNDITKLDELINRTEDSEEEVFDETEGAAKHKEKLGYALIPRNPQPRNRKVSVHDLVEALQRALTSKRRILAKQRPVRYTHHLGKKVDIMEVIRDLYHKITYYSEKSPQQKLTFSRLLPPNAGKMEKVFTFLPLLHLENQQKIETEQQHHFDEIFVHMKKGKKEN